jgi:hypothetical protein
MKTLKVIFMFLFTITVVNASYSQVGLNYKQPYNGRWTQTTLKKEASNSLELSTINHNYKHPIYKARTIQQVNNLVCCSKKSTNAFFSHSNYKQPYSKSIEKSCIQGLVCNGETTLACCKN